MATIFDFEKNKPEDVEFTHFRMKPGRQVNLVEGVVNIPSVEGIPAWYYAKWDGDGKCLGIKGRHNDLARNFDISL